MSIATLTIIDVSLDSCKNVMASPQMVILGYPYTLLLSRSAKRYAHFYKVPAGMRRTHGFFPSFSNMPAFNIGNALTTLTTVTAYPTVPVDGIPSCSYFIVRLREGY
jgi:hypothetical protein